jgi:TatD DNase family protein
MVLTDTHTHLYLEEFKEDVDLVIKKAISNNVSRFFLPAIN